MVPFLWLVLIHALFLWIGWWSRGPRRRRFLGVTPKGSLAVGRVKRILSAGIVEIELSGEGGSDA